MAKIKKSVSLYSMQYQYLHGNMDLKDMFDLLKELNVEGVELIPDQMIRNTPNPSQESIDNWNGLCETYNIKPVIADVFLNTNLYDNRELTPEECVELLKQEIVMCSKLGFNMIRLVSMVPSFVIEPLLPYCEQYNMKLGLEIHAGLSFDKDKTKGFIEEMERLNSPYIGLVIDAGIFCKRIPRVMYEYYGGETLSKDLVKYIDDLFKSGKDGRDIFVDGHLIGEVQALAKTENEKAFAWNCSGYENEDYSVLDPYMDKVFHIHGKIYEMTDDGEYSIDYKSFLEYLDSKDYDGYISTEYEGNRWTLPGEPLTEKENLIMHQNYLSKIINDLGGRKNV